jgi:hypothetical protein
MPRADLAGVGASEAGGTPRGSVWIVEDEPAAGALAEDLCAAMELEPRLFRSPLPFLREFRLAEPPSAVVLDWRLERELSAALFLATRYRFPELPVIYWTGTDPSTLPAMIVGDPLTRIVDKTDGTAAFEAALGWALTQPGADGNGNGDAAEVDQPA